MNSECQLHIAFSCYVLEENRVDTCFLQCVTQDDHTLHVTNLSPTSLFCHQRSGKRILLVDWKMSTSGNYEWVQITSNLILWYKCYCCHANTIIMYDIKSSLRVKKCGISNLPHYHCIHVITPMFFHTNWQLPRLLIADETQQPCDTQQCWLTNFEVGANCQNSCTEKNWFGPSYWLTIITMAFRERDTFILHLSTGCYQHDL